MRRKTRAGQRQKLTARFQVLYCQCVNVTNEVQGENREDAEVRSDGSHVGVHVANY